MSDPLSWRSYLESESRVAALPPAVLASWRRSEAAGVERGRCGLPPRVSDVELERRLARASALVEVARAHLRSLSGMVGDRPHVVYVTDRDAIVLHAEGDLSLRAQFGLEPGFDWSEAAMGTNGAGTALASGTAVAVVGPQHFVDAFEDCTCIAAPIRDLGGELIGAIDLSTGVADGRPDRLGLMRYAAQMIERDLAHKAEMARAVERLHIIRDHAPVFIYLVDEGGRFLDANRGWLERMGYESHAVIGRTLYDVFPPATAEAFLANNRRVLLAGSPMHFEELYDGRTYLSVKAPVRDTEGRPYAICGMSVDISERKLAEKLAHEAAAALREADRRKDEFLAMLAHELRNPLAPIRAAVQLMRVPGAAEPQLQRARDIVERQVAQLVRLIDDLLDVSRLTLGKLLIERKRLDLRAAAHDAVEMSDPQIQAGGHRFSLELPARPVWVEGDLARLAQVLSNLLNNAARYTPSGGEIALRLSDEGDEAVVSVADTGVGIAQEHLESIFEPFVQIGSGQVGSPGGLGVGLALVRQIVELHGGRVAVSSGGAGCGARFEVRLSRAG